MSSLPRRPYLVVDQNVLLRRGEMEALVARATAEGCLVLLSASAHYEIMNCSADSIVQILVLMVPAERFCAAKSQQVLLYEHEARFGQSPQELADRAATTALRECARMAQRGELDAARISAMLPDVRQSSQRWMDSHGWDTFFREMVARIRADNTPRVLAAEAQRLRLGDRASLRSDLARTMSRENLTMGLARVLNGRTSMGRRLAGYPSLIALHVLSTFAFQLGWAALGGIENTKESLPGYGCDVDAITLATHSRDLVTADKKARAVYEDVLAVSEVIWAYWFLSDAPEEVRGGLERDDRFRRRL
jgi:hypothetical protein